MKKNDAIRSGHADSGASGCARPSVPGPLRGSNGARRETQRRVTVAVDVMSGDRGPAVAVEAAIECLRTSSNLELILVGDVDTIKQLLSDHGNVDESRLRLQHASEIVSMDESAQQALRGKKDSSIRVAVNLVKNGDAQACISAGNTGALMATARFVLKTLPGIDRPAIISPIPTRNGGHTLMLDLGANTDCTSEHLLQFGVMGSALATAAYDIERPTIGLLNVGAEAIKGNDRVKQAANLLSDSGLEYIGFVEGDDIFSGHVDVVVSDGFVGNVTLKAIEGMAKMIGAYVREEFTRNAFTKLLGGISFPVLRSLKHRLDPRRYNGASLLGLNGVVIKSHGGADAVSFAHAIRSAALEADKQVPKLITRLLESKLAQESVRS